MYDWLRATLEQDGTCLLTANRRLARTLRTAYSDSQVAAGRSAWRSPAIHAFRDWLAIQANDAGDDAALPALISDTASRVLWEDSLREGFDDPFVNYVSLARQCRDTWQRMQDWCVPLADVESSARGQDQRIFARAAKHYANTLTERHWTDSALLPSQLAEQVRRGQLSVPGQLVLCGFDRVTPQAQALFDAMREQGSGIETQAAEQPGRNVLQAFPSTEAELRAAGAWARAQIEREPEQTVGIVISKLEQDAERSTALLREGFVPGWQYAAERLGDALNVSYGRKLGDFPAINTALRLLRWLHHPLGSADISLLLRSPHLGSGNGAGRSRLELTMRDWPDRDWSRALFLGAVRGADDSPDTADFLERLGGIGEIIEGTEPRMRPSDWAETLDTILARMNWPGDQALNSDDFQLDNRWRDLLNEFARLELVRPQLSGSEAVTRISSMAAETLFQTESEAARVSVIGPLEAAGLRFDKLWVSGATAADWPGATRALPLLSQELQRDYRMPDATPDDTALYARRTLDRLCRSAVDIVFSYPEVIGDAEQIPTPLLPDIERDEAAQDPGWHLSQLLQSDALQACEDRVPAVASEELIAGGASTIQRQATEPFSAFVHGRLGIRRLAAFTPGISALVRGNLVHDALHKLYAELPSQSDIAAWSEQEVLARAAAACDAAFQRYRQGADRRLLDLLQLEWQRTSLLLHNIVGIDCARPEFRITAVETGIAARIDQVRLKLRCDRIDSTPAGGLLILDYKTGSKKKLLTRDEPVDLQLFVYAAALAQPIDGLGLYNVDAKESGIDGAGPALGDDAEWAARLDGWKALVALHAAGLARGDVRINLKAGLKDARPLALLSRYAELQHGD